VGYFVQWDGVLLILDTSLTCQEELGKWNLESNEFKRSLHQSIKVLIIVRLSYVGVLINLWLFLLAAQPKEFFLDGLKKLEQ
jgi:hypothetical protein